MPEIQLPDGTIAEFPEGTEPAVMKAAIQKHLMTVGAERSVAGAEVGQQARSEAIDPTSMLQNMGQAAMIDSEGLPAQAKGSAVGGALGLAAIGAPTTLPAAGRMALGMAGAEVGSRYGGPIAARVGLPPEVGEFGGGLVGAFAPEAALARIAGRTAVNMALSARIAHTLNREAPEAVQAAGKVLQFGRASSSMPSEMAATMPRMAPGASQAAKALEGAGLSPELATAEAGKMAGATGEVSGNLPGVMTPAGGTPALKMPAISLAEDIQAQVAKLRASGLSKSQITAAVRETHNLEPGAAGKVVDTIFEHSGERVAATAEALPAGSRVMPSPRGGPAKPSMGPARVPTSDADLQSLLEQSIQAYKIK